VKSHTVHRTFETGKRREFVRITDDVQEAVDESGVEEGMVLVSAMHITAGVWVNDDEPGILEDALEWLDKLAPPSWREPQTEVARELLPDGGDYRHHRGGEDNGDAHFKNLLVHHQVVLPITAGQLDLGPWQQVFYAEFDGGRRKRLVIKVIGE
jgi:secondary thiamine-phosphate synthase enzyme